MHWLVLFSVFVVLVVSLGCSESAAPSPTENIGATVTAMVGDIPTQTPYPSLVPLSTLVPLPTYTPAPTYVPLPTYAALPTHVPLPTYTLVPPAEPYPTYTPVPDPTPYPTYTAVPAPTARTVIQVEQDRWQVDSAGSYSVLGVSKEYGAWVLLANCSDDEFGVFLFRVGGYIFSESGWEESSILVDYDGDVGEESWVYSPPSEWLTDYYLAVWSENVISNILEAEKVVYTISTDVSPYVVTFDVEGLDRHIEVPEDLC